MLFSRCIYLVYFPYAIKTTSRVLGFSQKSVKNAIKEKIICGDFEGPPTRRKTLTIFEKLSLDMRDAIRKAVMIV